MFELKEEYLYQAKRLKFEKTLNSKTGKLKKQKQGISLSLVTPSPVLSSSVSLFLNTFHRYST